MALFKKLIVYGGPRSGKYELADRLVCDNSLLLGPFIIANPEEMSVFLASPFSLVGIVHSTNASHVIRRCQAQNFGSVLFIPAPDELDSKEGLSAQEFAAALAAIKVVPLIQKSNNSMEPAFHDTIQD